jgi:PilZ domain-containing protein
MDAQSNQRAAPRYASSAWTSCQVKDPQTGATWPAWVRDISTSGISLLLEPRFDPGQRLAVEIKNLNRTLSRSLDIVVRHCDICFPNNCWLHGCSLSEPLSADELRRLAEFENHEQ